MAQIDLPDELMRRLAEIARRENRPVADVLADIVAQYAAPVGSVIAETDPLTAMAGMFDDDVTDLSTTIRETMDAYYRRKYGSTG